MKEFINPDRIANAIMLKSNSFKTFLVVEGETDFLVFNKFIDKQLCRIEVAIGCDNVIETLGKLKERGFDCALGVIDSDFRLLDKEDIEEENIIQTDYHDLEIMLIKSEALNNVMNHYIQADKFDQHYGNYDSFRNHLFQVCKHIGYLKWLNKQKKYGLIFKPQTPDGNHLDYNKFISVSDLTFSDYGTLIQTVLNFSNGKAQITVKKVEIEDELKKFITDCDLSHLCNGHDIVHIIALSLKRHLSNMNSRAVSHYQISKELGLAYEARFFEQTGLYHGIKEWEKSKQKPILSF